MGENWLHEPELAGTLSANTFVKDVDLVFDDGSRAHWRYAFIRREGDFWVAYTEHNGYHVYYAPSVVRISANSDLRE